MGPAVWVRARVRRSPTLTHLSEAAWKMGQRAVRGRKRRRYLAGTDLVRVMIGAGPARVTGWLATDLLPSRADVMFLDAGRRFPFEDGSVDRIHSEHMIEHIDHLAGRRMLRESFRVLRPGGRIRIATPDFERVAALAGPLTPDVFEMMRAANLRCGIDERDAGDPVYSVNRIFSAYGHRFLYSESRLRRELADAGFTGIERHELGESDDVEFARVDQRAERADADWMRYQTMVLEASRPERSAGGFAGPA